MYLALYRKYRPRTFDEVISQKYTTDTLKNQVANGSTGHAYLFTGSRGTGKTSCAKILAMAVNCEAPQNGNPCLKCDRCREILDGTATDIVEMDAASNNSVDDVRILCDEIAYTPVSCKFRVYIIDEVHMLSPQAFNALLKTLEEPPAHVKFILATTEAHKVLATISSRCQRFEFRRISDEASTKRLLEVAEKENIRLDKSAAEFISRLSDGGMRDALSILDRCAASGDDITAQTVRECAGIADSSHLFALSEMIAEHDTAGCIRLLNELHKGAKDISLIISELSGHYRDMMLYKTAPKNKELLNVLPDEQDKLFAIADMYTLDEVLRCLTLLQQCSEGIGRVKQRKTLAEMCFVRMCAGYDAGGNAGAVNAPAAVYAETPKPSARQTASPGNSAKLEYSEIEKEPLPVRKKSESEMSALERAQFVGISSELQKTGKLFGLAADAGAPAEKTEQPAAIPEPAAEQAVSVEKTEPPVVTEPEKAALTEDLEQSTTAPELGQAAPVEKTEPPVVTEPEKAALTEDFEQATTVPEPGQAAPVEKTEQPVVTEPEKAVLTEDLEQSTTAPEPGQAAPVEKTEQPEIISETAAEQTAPVEEIQAPVPPPVTRNDDAAPIDNDIPDYEDYGEPPPEYPENGEYGGLAAGFDIEAAKPRTREPEIHEKAPVIIDKESAANIAKLTQEQWNAAVLKTGAFYSKMLENSLIKAEGDILVISTSNKTILNNVKGREVANYEKEISKALGFHVHLKFVSAAPAEKKTESSSPLQRFLDKCASNNITVNIFE